MTWKIKRLILGLFLCSAGSCFAAESLSLTFAPLTDPVLYIPQGQVRELHYILVNHGSKSYHLQMMPINGVTQQTDKPGFCTMYMELDPEASCILSLVVHPPEHDVPVKAIQLLCEYEADWYRNAFMRVGSCVQPETEAELSIYPVSSEVATLSVAIKLHQAMRSGQKKSGIRHCFSSFAQCTLALFQGTETPGYIRITNTSAITALGIQALNLPNGVTQDASQCTVLAPGNTCYLKFFPGTTKTTGETVVIGGMNTIKSSIIMQVLGIGDQYNGNLLVQLPTAATQYNYYTTTAVDASSAALTWDDANMLCTNNSLLAGPTQLTLLAQASNCNGGPIEGFVCSTPYYWGAAQSASNAYAVNIVTSQVSFFSTNSPYLRVRCVQKYQLTPMP